MLKYTDYDIVFQEIPDEVTLAINLSNCPYRCKGCHSPQLREDIGTPLSNDEIIKLLNKYGDFITCICLMGGDASVEDIEQSVIFIKKYSKGHIKTAWYSGCDYICPNIDLDHFNYIKVGAYKEDLGALKSKTTNQRFYKINNSQLIDMTYLMQK